MLKLRLNVLLPSNNKLLLKYPLPLIKVTFLKRYKRFFVDVQKTNGETLTVHCANTGSMKSCLIEGAAAYILDSQSEKRKLRYSLELLELEDGFACLNTSRANQFIEAHLLQNNNVTVKREAVFSAHTRFDFCLTSLATHKKCWIEVKSVSLKIAHETWAFPDAVTERGQKHLRELITAKQNGDNAWLYFVLMRGSSIAPEKLCAGFRAAHEIDARYADLLKEAKKEGVRVAIVVPGISTDGFSLRKFYVQ